MKVGYGVFFDYGNPKEETEADRFGRSVYEAFWKLWKIRVTFDTFLGLIPGSLEYLEDLGLYKSVFYSLFGPEPEPGVFCEESRSERLTVASHSGANLMLSLVVREKASPGVAYHVQPNYKEAKPLLEAAGKKLCEYLDNLDDLDLGVDTFYVYELVKGMPQSSGSYLYRRAASFPYPSLTLVLPPSTLDSKFVPSLVKALTKGLEEMRNAL